MNSIEIVRTGLAVGACSLLSFLVINKVKDKFVYFPTKADQYNIPDLTRTEKHLKALFNDQVTLKSFNIKNSDGTTINGIVMRNPESKNWMLFSHGNAGNIFDRLHMFDRLGVYGSVVMYDYRGYGASNGSPSEIGLQDDIFNVWKYMINQEQINPNSITVWGESLGGSVSSWLCSHLIETTDTYPSGLILQSSFSSLKNVVKDMYGPLSFIIRDEHNTTKYLSKIDKAIPVFVLHSKDDELILYNHSDKMKDSNSSIIQIDIGGTHNRPIIHSVLSHSIIHAFYSKKLVEIKN